VQVVADNRAGAGGTASSARAVASRRPDHGYTICMPGRASISPSIYPRLGFDP
jgi:hypothetical protein